MNDEAILNIYIIYQLAATLTKDLSDLKLLLE